MSTVTEIIADPAELNRTAFRTRYAAPDAEFKLEQTRQGWQVTTTATAALPRPPLNYGPRPQPDVVHKDDVKTLYDTPDDTGVIIDSTTQILLEEINKIRAALLPPLPPITLTATRDAIRALL